MPCCQEMEKFLPEQEDELRRAADPSPRGTENAAGPPVAPSTTNPLTSIHKHARAGRTQQKQVAPLPKKYQCNYSELKSSLEKRVGDACDTASPVRRPRVRRVRAAGPRAATPRGGVHSFPERKGSHTEVTGRVCMASPGPWGPQLSGSGSPSSCPSQSCLWRREHAHKDHPSTGRSPPPRPPRPLWTRACLRATLTSYQI